jgi:hypothetical protein
MTITNAAGLDVTIKDWIINVNAGGVTGVPGVNGFDGLINDQGTAATADDTVNYSLIKLVKLNDDGTASGTLLGSSELSLTGGDITQPVTLKGTASISSGESVKAAIVFDVANNSNAIFAGDTVKCELTPVTGADMVKDSNNDMLGAANITPTSLISGNFHTIVQSALTFIKNSSPTNMTKYAKGTSLATMLAFQVKAGSSLDTTIKSLAVEGDHIFTGATATVALAAPPPSAVALPALTLGGAGYYTIPAVTFVGGTCTVTPSVTATIAGGLVTGFAGLVGGLCTVAPTVVIDPPALSTTDIKDLADSIGVYDSTGLLVSDLKSFPASTAGTNSAIITFNNLDIEVAKNTTVNYFIKGMVSNSLASAVNTEFNLTGTPLVIDQNGQTVTGVDITAVDGLTPGTDSLQLIFGTTPTVTDTSTSANDPKIYTEGSTGPVYGFTLKSTDGSTTLQDMTVNLIAAGGTTMPAESVALYSATSSTCTSTTLLKDYESVETTGALTGRVKFTNIAKALPDSQNVYLCVSLKAKMVSSSQPSSLTTVTIDPALGIVFDKITDQSGAVIAPTTNPLLPALTPSTFFAGVPTFAPQSLATTVLTNGAELEVLKLQAGSIGTVNTLNQLTVTFEGVVPASCDLYKDSTLLRTGGAPIAPVGTKVTFLPAYFTSGVSTNWSNGSNYIVKCTYAAAASGTSTRAKLAPSAAAPASAIIWDDGNGATLTDVAFGAVDSVIFFSNVIGEQLSTNF